jgi:phenylpropionate dioxygenase-like ring-hydroxylating dioxygenase large terminal subunit
VGSMDGEPARPADGPNGRHAAAATTGMHAHWYVACLSTDLGRRRPVDRTVLGVPMALFRGGDGRVAAVIDRCPHRNVPLSLGTVEAGLLQCSYHGWRFDSEGACRAVPGLLEEPDRRARRVDTFPTAEHDGFVWVFPTRDVEPSTSPFRFPWVDEAGYETVRRSLSVTASLHTALENTLDVPHTAFLHGGLFRGGREPVDIDVVVRHTDDGVEAEYLGEPRPPGLAGRILAPEGGVVTHFDRFVLPSIAQVEYRLGANHLVTTSAFTPVGEFETRLHAAVTFRVRLPAAAVKAAVTPIANRIFAQDERILRHQSESIRRFGGEHFASTELDVLGQHILRLLRRAERGEAGGEVPSERRFRMRV